MFRTHLCNVVLQLKFGLSSGLLAVEAIFVGPRAASPQYHPTTSEVEAWTLEEKGF